MFTVNPSHMNAILRCDVMSVAIAQPLSAQVNLTVLCKSEIDFRLNNRHFNMLNPVFSRTRICCYNWTRASEGGRRKDLDMYIKRQQSSCKYHVVLTKSTTHWSNQHCHCCARSKLTTTKYYYLTGLVSEGV